MSTLKLNPWPFGSTEEVLLYWHGYPFMNERELWMIKCLFKRQGGSFKEVAFPFATLPALRIGQYYVDGKFSERLPVGSLLEVKVPLGVIKSENICKSYNFPKSLYAFIEPHTYIYGNLPVCRFVMNGINYYIPCTEIVRSILAPNKLYANQILKPEGLDQFIAGSHGYKDKLEISLTADYDTKFLSDDMVSYFTWLRYDKEAYRSWNSVYKNMLFEASKGQGTDLKNEFKKGIPIKVIPPQSSASTWRFRGVEFINHVLILELIHRSDLVAPFTYIECSHPKLEKLEGDKKPRYRKDPGKNASDDQEIELDFTGEGAENSNGNFTAEQTPAMFSFNRKPKVFKKRNKTRRVLTGEIIVIGTKDDSADDNTATTQDWVYGGKIPQIEFPLLKMVDISLTKGLEEFLKMLEYMQQNYILLSLNLTIVALPQHKGFSQYENGGIRPVAIVRIDHAAHLPCYIVEVGKADNWSISTLIIEPVDDEHADVKTFQIFINKLLYALVDGNGHWEKSLFHVETRYNIKIAKHMSDQAIKRWAERIVEKMIL